MSKVNLLKEREAKVTVSLKKITQREIICKVNLVLDISGSMCGAYSSGKVQSIVEKIFPIASKLTPNGVLGMWVFSDKYFKLNDLDINNFEGYVHKFITSKSLIGGGTYYAPVINSIKFDPQKTFWYKLFVKIKRLLGFKVKTDINKKLPVFNIFITDGDNTDRWESEKAIIDSSKTENFFQFVGTWGNEFNFLSKLDNLSGRFIDNVNFFEISNIDSMSEEDLYDALLKEFPLWLDKAEENNII
jgi:hypothetical protein